MRVILFLAQSILKRGCKELTKVGKLTKQKGIVGNPTPWQEREKIYFRERLKSSSISISSALLSSVNMESSWLHGP